MWRLTKNQYRATVAWALDGRQASLTASYSFPKEVVAPFDRIAPGDRYSNIADSYTMDDDDFASVLDAADAVGRLLVTRVKAANGSCLPQATTTAALTDCLGKLVAARGELLFRRPLTAAEVDRYVGVAMRNLDTVDGGRDAALALAFQAMLVSPKFLYRLELGRGAADGARRKLDPYEIAAALSYTLTDRPPDTALWSAASDGRLAGADEIKAQLARIMGANLEQSRLADFVREYMRWDQMPAKFPSTSRPNPPNNKCGLAGLDMVVTDAQWTVKGWLDRNGRKDLWKTIMTSNDYTIRDRTKGFYGLSRGCGTNGQPEDSPIPVTVPADRAGFLTFPAFITALSAFNDNKPVARGRYMRESLICKPVPELPIGQIPLLPDLGPSATLRERQAMHSAIPSCAACHHLMDPLGLPFEQYDDIGLLRQRDQGGKPVNATGQIADVGSADGPVDGVADMARRLAAAPEVERCFLRQDFRYYMGREEQARDACTIKALQDTYRASGGDMSATLAALFTSSSFLYRTAN